MAENEKLEQTKQPAPDKKSEKKAKPGIFARAGKWLKELKVELKKVVWPNRQTVLKNTGTVLLCSLAIGVCIWIFDFVATSAVQMILNVFGA